MILNVNVMVADGGGCKRAKTVSANTAKLSKRDQSDYNRWISYGRGCPQGSQVVSFKITDKTHYRSPAEVFFEELPSTIFSEICDALCSTSTILSGANSIASLAESSSKQHINAGEYAAIHVETEYFLQNPVTKDWVYNMVEFDCILVYPQTGNGDVELHDYHWPD